MKHLLVIGLLLGATALAQSPQPTADSPTTTRAAPPTTQAVSEAQVRRLVRQLGAREFDKRQAAQKKLADLGEAAMPHLVDFIGHANPEIATRVSALIKRPADPDLRVEVVVRLLSTGEPDNMESAVYMLFEDPLEDYARFVQRTEGAVGVQRAVFEPVAEQLKFWKESTERFNRFYARIKDEKPEAAAKQLELHRGSKYYQAEAAYWQAVEAVESYEESKPKSPPTTTNPSKGG